MRPSELEIRRPDPEHVATSASTPCAASWPLPQIGHGGPNLDHTSGAPTALNMHAPALGLPADGSNPGSRVPEAGHDQISADAESRSRWLIPLHGQWSVLAVTATP